MIYGETTHTDGTPILNIRWPQRGLFRVIGHTDRGTPVDAYVWDDCTEDAIASVLDWLGEEDGPADNFGLVVIVIRGATRAVVVHATNEANAVGTSVGNPDAG